MHLLTRNRLLPPLLAAALMTACGFFRDEPRMVMERLDFGAIEGELPGWEPGGHADPFVEGDLLVIPASGRVSHPLEVEDYPIAIHLTVQPEGTAMGFLVVTRASNDTAGPYGLPRHGVVFAVWAESRLAFNPWNAGVLLLDGDRLVPISRARFPVEDEVIMDVFDDGRWVLFALNGEVLCATITPDKALPENMLRRGATQVTQAMSALLPGERTPSGGNVVLAAPQVLADIGGRATVSDVALIRRAPPKTEGMRQQWENLVTWDQLRITRALHGQVLDAETEEPIPGVMIAEESGLRQIFTDLDGRFLDSRVVPGSEPPYHFVLYHPDYPATPVTIPDQQSLGRMEQRLVREGDVELVLDLSLDPTAENLDVPVLVSLVPDDGRPVRVNHTPPYEGPLLYRHLLPGEYHVEVRFKNRPDPHISEPFRVTGEREQVHSLTVAP